VNAMVRLCERPGCSIPADVSYGFDAEQLIVWLDTFQAAQGASSGVLCRRHADAMVVPLSWMLDDRREPAPRLFRAPIEAPTGPMIRPRAKRERVVPSPGVVQLELDAYDRPAELASAVEEAVTEVIAVGQRVDDPAPSDDAPVEQLEDDPTEVLPWQPVFDERDDLHGLLKARGRLLSRAFNGPAAAEH
jgi:hypothetical protein